MLPALLALVAVPDPSSDPLGAYASLKALWTAGAWPMVALIGTYYAALLAALLGRETDVPWLAVLGTGRVAATIATVASIASAAIATLTDKATWGSVALAVLSSAILHHAPVNPVPPKAS